MPLLSRFLISLIAILFVYSFIQARPYIHGLVGGVDKERLNQKAQKQASNYVYARELKHAIEAENDPKRKDELEKELSHLKY